MVLKDKVVWITGASSGIGEALFNEFCNCGAKLIISARNIDKLKELQLKATQKGISCQVFPFDLSDAQALSEACKKVLEQNPQIDILVNNGGVSQRSLVNETPIDIDRKIMEINFFGAISVTKNVLPLMIQQNGGKIVVISSVVGKFGFPLRSAYSASKHALHGFYDALRAELVAKNISVLMVCPGKIATNISKNAITKDGTANNIMDKGHVNGMPPDVCAKKIILAIKRNKKEIYLGGKEVLMVYIKRFLPVLFYKLASKVKPT